MTRSKSLLYYLLGQLSLLLNISCLYPAEELQNRSMHRTKQGNEDKALGQEELNVVPIMSLSLSTLQDIRNFGAIYVDRTELVYKIIKDPKRRISLFMRPRRFGKSLLLDVFEAILRHNKNDMELLQGTYVQDLAQKLPMYAVLRFNFLVQRTIVAFGARIMEYARSYGVSEELVSRVKEDDELNKVLKQEKNECVATFPILLKLLKEKSLVVAVLVDEYNVIFERTDDEATRDYFFKFFESFKELMNAKQLEFVFITGCDKVKVNVDGQRLNQGLGTTLGIDNISDETEFAHLVGFTEDEIRKYYDRLVRIKAEVCQKPIEEIYRQIKYRYDGYLFGDNDSPKVYNPVSVMEYLEDKNNFEGDNYWMQTVPDSTALERIIKNHLLDLNKDVLNLNSSFTREELFEKERNPNALDKHGLGALLYRHGYLTTAKVEIVRGEKLCFLKFPNYEALEAFQRAVTNAMAMTKNAAELSKTAWRCLNEDLVDMDGFAKAFNNFIKLPACQFLVRHVSRDFESFFKHFVEVMMNVAICNGCNMHRGETLSRPSRPDFIFDTQDKRIFVVFKYESSETNFRGKYFNQLKKYKFHACEKYHPKDKNVRKIKILINFDRNGNLAQWYGPKEYKFDTKAEGQKSTAKKAENQELATETFENKYLTTLQAFPKLSKQ